MQATIAAGDTLSETVSATNTPAVAAYPPSDGWTLKYRLVPRISGTAISITATTSGEDYVVTVAPATTATWGAGDYGWFRWVEKTGYRHEIDSGQVTIISNPATVAVGTDTRSQAQKAVDDLLAAKATFTATNGNVKRYVIGNREMEFKTASEIDEQYNFWQARLTREKAQIAVALGYADPRRIYIRATGRA